MNIRRTATTTPTSAATATIAETPAPKARKRRVRRIAALATALAAVSGSALATAGAAHADGFIVLQTTTPYWVAASNDSMPVSVAEAASWANARVIQWWNTGGNEQKWYFDSVYTSSGQYLGFMLRNKNSNLCLDSDGVAGDELYQFYCTPYYSNEIFNTETNYDLLGIPISYDFVNYGTGLKLDVAGASTNGGANIDLWYSNGGINQHFYITQAP